MSLCYRNLSLSESIKLTNEVTLIHLYIRTKLNTQDPNEKGIITGYLPPLITSCITDSIYIRHFLLAKCKYVVSVSALDMFPSRSLKINKRVKTLDLYSNGIQSMARCHSNINNKKITMITMLPSSLLRLDISSNPIFRVILTSSLRRFLSFLCSDLKELKYRESLIAICYFMGYHKKPKTNQKSIRYFRLGFSDPEIYFGNKYVSYGSQGVYNDFIRLRSAGIVIKQNRLPNERLNIDIQIE